MAPTKQSAGAVTRRILAVALVLLVMLAAAATASTALRLSGKGIVLGGIEPCSGIAMPGGPRYAAGTVTVLKGPVNWASDGSGVSKDVLPTDVAATEALAVNGTYWFELDQGSYVLQARYASGATVVTWVELTVPPGSLQHVDVPNRCI